MVLLTDDALVLLALVGNGFFKLDPLRVIQAGLEGLFLFAHDKGSTFAFTLEFDFTLLHHGLLGQSFSFGLVTLVLGGILFGLFFSAHFLFTTGKCADLMLFVVLELSLSLSFLLFFPLLLEYLHGFLLELVIVG